jgi:hypothetical protein
LENLIFIWDKYDMVLTMREYFAHKLISSLDPWPEVDVLNSEKVLNRYGRFYVSVDFLVCHKKKSALILVIDGNYKADGADVKFSLEVADELRQKIIATDKADVCDIIVCGRHKIALSGYDVVDMTGIYNHETCFVKLFDHLKGLLGLAVVPAVKVGCGWWRLRRLQRKRSNLRIMPTLEPFAMTHAKVVDRLNKVAPAGYASPHIKITDSAVPYGVFEN